MNDRQRLFVQFYLETMNGGEAARRAGYSPKAAYQTASLLLRNAKVRAAVDAGMHERAMGVDEVLSRLSDIARLDFTGFTNDAGNLDLVEARRCGLLRFVKKWRELRAIALKPTHPLHARHGFRALCTMAALIFPKPATVAIGGDDGQPEFTLYDLLCRKDEENESPVGRWD
ncbi:MAG: terminase small subunit [Deltaproteobacteria bacterium]|nr:terminase small subunit [Deltaproteobacteria bacterium]